MSAVQNDLWPDNVLTDPKQVANMYNKKAAIYAKASEADGWNATFSIVNSELTKILPTLVKSLDTGNRESVKVLDAGCGDGLLADNFDFKKYGVQLHGIEIATEMLAIAGGKGKYHSLKIASVGENIPFDEGYLDVVIANGVLGYFSNNKPLYEFLRVLKSGGYILLTNRTHHLKDRGYEDAFHNLSDRCKVTRREVFKPYPNNPDFKHEYQFIAIQKIK